MRVHSSFKALSVALSLTLLASGCATTREASDVRKTSVPLIQDRFQGIATPQQTSSTFKVDSGFYAARTPIMTAPVNARVQLPESFFKNANMNIQTPTSLMEITARIARLSGYQVFVDQDVTEGSSGAGSSAPAQAAAPPMSDPSLPPTGLPPLPTSAPSFAATPMSVGNDLVLNEVLFNGNLTGLLDAVTAKLNLSWRWTGDRVEIYRYETKMFRLNALPGQTDVSSNLDTTSSSLSSEGGSGGGSSGGGSSGGEGGVKASSGSTTSMSSSMEIWKEVEDAIKGVLSDKGKMSMTPSAGLVTVRDTPGVLRQVEAQISEFNRIYSRQITMNVEVYAIERNSSDDASINWNLAWANSGVAATETTQSFNGSPGSFTIGVNGGPFSGSQVVASVLSKLGKATLLTSVPVTTLNGQTVPVNVSRDRAYVASVSSTVNGSDTGGGTTSTITPGVVSEGFSMNVMPRILEDNNVVIRYAVDLATIEGITTFTSPDGRAAVQLPQRAVRNFLQNVKVKSGQTMVLTGFQQVTGTQDSSGPGSPSAWFLGGGKSANVGTRTLVIVITPYVLRN
jgi:type IVB pilus formation R64 PilN family outer membrane protein